MPTTLPTELEMRASEAPTPKTPEELISYIRSQLERQHDYGTCAAATSLCAAAAFNYAQDQMGLTVFQAGCASLDLMRRVRGIDGPFIVLQLEDALYPQCEPGDKLEKFLEGNRSWLRFEARKKIASNPQAHPDVFHHWCDLASFAPSEKADVAQWNRLAPDDIIPEEQPLRQEWYDRNREEQQRNCRHHDFIQNDFTEGHVRRVVISRDERGGMYEIQAYDGHSTWRTFELEHISGGVKVTAAGHDETIEVK